MTQAARILDGKATADRVIAQVAERVEQRCARGLSPPGLAVILVGEDPASRVYVGNKKRACQRAGIHTVSIELPADTSQQTLLDEIDRLNADPAVHGILVQLPLPDHLDATQITERILPQKDVDGFHPFNVGKLVLRQPALSPCTPRGVMRLLHEYGIPVRGRNAVVVGASNIVGRPMYLELLMAGATVTNCHRFTRDLPDRVREAEILVVAVGKPGIVQGDWVRPGAVVVDVGINRTEDGKLCGDVDFEAAARHAAWITPVPGGVGPMTVATLLVNTLQASGDVLWPVDGKGGFLPV